jgi:hypothetical protein
MNITDQQQQAYQRVDPAINESTSSISVQSHQSMVNTRPQAATNDQSYDFGDDPMDDHKQHILIDAFTTIALTTVLITEGRTSGQPVFQLCSVDPFFELLRFLLFI